MATEIFYPFAVGDGTLVNEVKSLTADVVRLPDGTWDAYSNEPLEVKLSVVTTIGAHEIERFLPPESTAKDLVHASLVFRGRDGRSRFSVSLNGEIGRWENQVTLSRSDWSGTVDMSTVLVLNDKIDPKPGFASDKGAGLAWSNPVKIAFDHDEVTPKRSLQIDWVHFKPEPELTDDHLFALQSEQEGPPTILLNLDFDNAYAILDSKGRHGNKARIRDATFQVIVHQCWSAILSDLWKSLCDVCGVEEPPEEPLAELPTWEQGVVTDWAPYLFFEADGPKSAVSMLIEAAGADSSPDMYMRRIPVAIQSRFETYKGFSGLVREIHSLESTGGDS